MIRLPLCPCNSGKLYEDCCYKRKGSDGEPLFFKGALNSPDGGKAWHPIPNVRFAAIIVGQAIDKYREYATQLVTGSTLGASHHPEFINLYASFYQSYEQLLKTLQTPGGKGVSFQMDTTEARKLWKDYLFHGRILLDFVGLHSRETLGLKQDIGGLNEKKFDLILTALRKLAAQDKRFLGIEVELLPLRDDILTLVRIRDKEKSPQDTILEFPAIDAEYGLVEDGKISLDDGATIGMIKFIKQSYESIGKLTLILLGTKHKPT